MNKLLRYVQKLILKYKSNTATAKYLANRKNNPYKQLEAKYERYGNVDEYYVVEIGGYKVYKDVAEHLHIGIPTLLKRDGDWNYLFVGDDGWGRKCYLAEVFGLARDQLKYIYDAFTKSEIEYFIENDDKLKRVFYELTFFDDPKLRESVGDYARYKECCKKAEALQTLMNDINKELTRND